MTERFNRTLLSMLGTLEPNQKSNWAAHLGALTHAYNCSKHESTGHSPFHLMFLRKPKIPVDLLYPVPAPEVPESYTPNHEYPPYIRQLRQHMRKVYLEVQATAEKSRAKQKAGYDKKVHESILQPGDRVLVANKSVRGVSKLKDRWEAVPYVVVRKLQGIPSYAVRRAGTSTVRTLHHNMLMLCPFDVTPTEASSSGRDEAHPIPGELTSCDNSSDVVLPPDGFRDTDVQPLQNTSKDVGPEESSRNWSSPPPGESDVHGSPEVADRMDAVSQGVVRRGRASGQDAVSSEVTDSSSA